MAVGTDSTIMVALLEHLHSLTFTPALEIADPGEDFPGKDANNKPRPKPANYLHATFLPNTTTNSELGAGQEQHRGLLQVSVFWTKGVGHVKPLDVAGQIIAHFAKGTTLHAGGLKVVIDRKPYASSPLEETDRVQIPVTIQYHAFS